MIETRYHCPFCEVGFGEGTKLGAHLAAFHGAAFQGFQHEVCRAAEPGWRGEPGCGTIMVPLDVGRPLPLAVHVAEALACRARLGLEFVSVTDSTAELGTRAYLHAVVEHARNAGVRSARWRVLGGGSGSHRRPDEVLVDELRRAPPDMVCMTATHHRPGGRMLGGVSKGVLEHTPVPVLLVGPSVVYVDRVDGMAVFDDGHLDGRSIEMASLVAERFDVRAGVVHQLSDELGTIIVVGNPVGRWTGPFAEVLGRSRVPLLVVPSSQTGTAPSRGPVPTRRTGPTPPPSADSRPWARSAGCAGASVQAA